MRILLVEDDPKHGEDAVGALHAAGLEFMHAVTEGEAHAYLDHAKEHGITHVITDLFMPHSSRAPWNHVNDPCGLAVALKAEKLGIPFVICTAGYHHGSRYDWICQIGRSRGWPEMVDQSAGGYEGEAPSKDWAKAISELVSLK
jgi:CheY-like chemotaxis protein